MCLLFHNFRKPKNFFGGVPPEYVYEINKLTRTDPTDYKLYFKDFDKLLQCRFRVYYRPPTSDVYQAEVPNLRHFDKIKNSSLNKITFAYR